MFMNQETENLSTKKQLAEKLQVHPNTIDNLRDRGVIQAIHLGSKTIRYSYSEIVNRLKQQQQQPQQEREKLK
jgi:hypothetical protein